MITQPEATGGAVPQEQAMAGKSNLPKLPPDQMNALRNDPEIKATIEKFLGRPFEMSKLPDDMLMTIAGMIHKLGPDGAIAEFKRLVPPQELAKMRIGAEGATNHPRRNLDGTPI